MEESTRISTPTPTTITTSTTCKRSLSRSYSEDNIHLEEHTLLRYPPALSQSCVYRWVMLSFKPSPVYCFCSVILKVLTSTKFFTIMMNIIENEDAYAIHLLPFYNQSFTPKLDIF